MKKNFIQMNLECQMENLKLRFTIQWFSFSAKRD